MKTISFQRQIHKQKTILHIFHLKLSTFIFQEISIARKNAKTNKRLALQALKRKKRYDRQLLQVRY